MLPPIKLTPQQDDLCRRLDLLNQQTIQGQKMSEMFIGGLYAAREENRNNPDWKAQSAHSFREILYPFYWKRGRIRVGDALRLFGSATIEEKEAKGKLDMVYGKITDIAHHKPVSSEEYERIIEDFQDALNWVLCRQVDIHNQIDRFFSGNAPGKGDK